MEKGITQDTAILNFVCFIVDVDHKDTDQRLHKPIFSSEFLPNFWVFLRISAKILRKILPQKARLRKILPQKARNHDIRDKKARKCDICDKKNA